jgi:hypothetical protein
VLVLEGRFVPQDVFDGDEADEAAVLRDEDDSRAGKEIARGRCMIRIQG